jgi:hypothetical protein
LSLVEAGLGATDKVFSLDVKSQREPVEEVSLLVEAGLGATEEAIFLVVQHKLNSTAEAVFLLLGRDGGCFTFLCMRIVASLKSGLHDYFDYLTFE